MCLATTALKLFWDGDKTIITIALIVGYSSTLSHHFDGTKQVCVIMRVMNY